MTQWLARVQPSQAPPHSGLQHSRTWVGRLVEAGRFNDRAWISDHFGALPSLSLQHFSRSTLCFKSWWCRDWHGCWCSRYWCGCWCSRCWCRCRYRKCRCRCWHRKCRCRCWHRKCRCRCFCSWCCCGDWSCYIRCRRCSRRGCL